MHAIQLAVLRDGRRGSIVDKYDSDEFGDDVLYEIAFAAPGGEVETETVPAGDCYVFELGGGAPRLTWRPVDVEINNTRGWDMESAIRLYVHRMSEYFAPGIPGARGHVPVVADVTRPAGYVRDQFEGALLAAEMSGWTEMHVYVDDHVDVAEMLGGWAELLEGDSTGRVRLPAAPVDSAIAARGAAQLEPDAAVDEARAAAAAAPTVDPVELDATIELALSEVKEEWIDPQFEAALRAVDPRAWTESVLSPGVTLRALHYRAPEEIRVVVLGQDPYPKPGKANGLAFGLSPEWIAANGDECVDGSTFGNIVRELRACGHELGDWTLESLARAGVLLLNTQLSVAPGKPKSHVGLGWEAVVDAVLLRVPAEATWITWGSEARLLAQKYTTNIVATSHPTRYSATRGSQYAPAFVGSKCFAAANTKLVEAGLDPIDWSAVYAEVLSRQA